MSPSAHPGASIAARAVVALMRAVPALFTTGCLVAATVRLPPGRLEHALVGLVVAAIAASFGVRIALSLAARQPSDFRKGFETSAA